MLRSAVLLAIVTLSGVVLSQRVEDRNPSFGREERDNTLRECFGKVADVFFVLDSSSSIYVEDYREVLKFVSQVVTRFDVSRDDTRVAALTFSDDYQLGFDLDRSRSKSEALASVNERALPYRTGVTNTDLALRYVREDHLFRQDITKVMIVITDGGSRNQGATRIEADLARDAGFHMVVVGIGQYQDEQEWRSIASDPHNDYIFNITSFNFLDSLIDSLPRRVCLMPPIIIGGECTVRENADIFFLAAPNGMNDALDVVKELSENFINKDRLQTAYLMEACEDDVDRGFNRVDNFCDRFGDAIPQADNSFRTQVEAMRAMADRMKQDPNRNARQVAVLFIDDRSMEDDRFDILQQVRNAEQFNGIDIIPVDLGVQNYGNFVAGMTSDRDNVVDFVEQSVRHTSQQILERICNYVSFGGFNNGDILPS